MSEVRQGRGVAQWGGAGDILGEDIFNACRELGLGDSPSTADGHSVDHGTAYFPRRRFPKLPTFTGEPAP